MLKERWNRPIKNLGYLIFSGYLIHRKDLKNDDKTINQLKENLNIFIDDMIFYMFKGTLKMHY